MDYTSNDSSGLGRRMATGAGWMVMLHLADRAIGLVSLTILARLLLPEDFGLLAMATVLIALLEIFGEFRVDLALIRDQKAERRHYDTAWTIKIIKGMFLTALLACLASPAAAFFEEPRVEAIVYWLALASAIGGFENIGTVNFRKNLEFKKEFTFLFTSRLFSTVVTIVLAYLWREYWALVVGVIIQRTIRVALSYIIQSYKPKFSLAGFKDIFNFSKWLMVQNTLSSLSQHSAAFVIGRLLNTNALAYYSLAHEISHLPTTDIRAPIRAAIFPGFVKMASDIGTLKKSFINSFSMMFLIGLPIPVGIALTAPFIVRVFLGENWLDTVSLIKVLALNNVVQSFGPGSYTIYLSLNRPQIWTFLSALRLLILLPLLILGVLSAGAFGAAWALVLTTMLILVVDFPIVLRLLQVDFKDIIVAIWRAIIAVLVMAVGVYFLQSFFLVSDSVLLSVSQLVASTLVGAFTYTSVALALWHLCGRPAGAESQVIGAVRGVLNRFLRIVSESWSILFRGVGQKRP